MAWRGDLRAARRHPWPVDLDWNFAGGARRTGLAAPGRFCLPGTAERLAGHAGGAGLRYRGVRLRFDGELRFRFRRHDADRAGSPVHLCSRNPGGSCFSRAGAVRFRARLGRYEARHDPKHPGRLALLQQHPPARFPQRAAADERSRADRAGCRPGGYSGSPGVDLPEHLPGGYLPLRVEFGRLSELRR